MTSLEQAPIREVELAQGTIRYREVGSGPTIVFVHGLLVNGLLWRKVVERLKDEFHCIAPDLPLGSHSRAMKADADLSPAGQASILAAFIEALGLDDVTLVGNDTGGAISQLVVTEHPEHIGRLVLLSCDAYEAFPPRLFSYLKLAARLPGGTAMVTQGMRLRLMRRAPIAYGWATKRPLDRAISDAYVEPILRDRDVRRDVTKFLRTVSPRYTLDAATRFGRFDRPVLIGWAAEDRFFPWELGERLAKAFPNSRLERIADARTFVPEDQPGRTAELIAGFAREPAMEVAGASS